MRKELRIIRNILLAAFVVMAAVVVMPKNVWASSASFSQSTIDVKVGETKDVTFDLTLEGSDSWEIPTVAGYPFSFTTTQVTKNAKYTVHITGISVGTNKIIANINGSKAAEITVNVISATKSISLSDVTIEDGVAKEVTATLSGYAAAPTIDWTSSDLSIASVGTPTTTATESKVTITPLKTGSVTITAKDSGEAPPITASVTITIKDKVTITGYSTPIAVGETVTLGTTLVPTGGTVTWESLNPTIATVNSTTGVVTGVAAGTATIKATSSGGGTSTIAIEVKPVTVTATIPEFVISGSSTAAITPTVSSPYTIASNITWSSAPAGLTINKAGDGKITISGTTPGTYSVIATVTGNAYKGSVGTIDVIPALATKSVLPATATTGIGSAVKLTASGTSGAYDSVEWVLDSGSATISAVAGDANSANVTPTATGTVNVYARFKYKGTVVGDTSVSPSVITVKGITSISTSDIYVTKGYKVKGPKITVDPAGIYTPTWSTSDKFEIVGTTDEYTVEGKATTSGTDYTVTINGVTSAAKKIYVYDVPSLSYSDNKLSISLPSKIYTGTKDVSDVSKGVLKVFYDGSQLWSSDPSTDYKNGVTLSTDKLQSIISKSDIYNKVKDLDKDTCELEFRIYGSDGSTTNEQAYGSTKVNVYKVTVSGSGLTTTKQYAVNGYSLKLTATPASGYTFSTWADGTTTNPRTITVNGSQTYSATGVLGAQNTTNRSSSSSGSNASNSRYDSVPKTGEGNGVIFMWIVLIISILGAGAVVLLTIKNSNITKK